MRQISLVDVRLLPPERLLSGARLIALGALGLLLAMAHFGIERQRLSEAMVAAGMVPETAEAIVATSDDDARLQALIVRRQALRDMLAKSDSLPPDSAGLLAAVIQSLPDTVWLTEVDLAGSQGLRIAGGATDPAALRTLAGRLAAIPALRGVPVETVRIEPQIGVQNGEQTGEQTGPPAHGFVLASTAYAAVETGR